MASGALPHGFPLCRSTASDTGDGGISCNTPLWYAVDEDYRVSALILQVDVFSGAGESPNTPTEAQERTKDIQYASKTRFDTTCVSAIEALRNSLRWVPDKLPPSLQADPDVQKLSAISTRGAVAPGYQRDVTTLPVQCPLRQMHRTERGRSGTSGDAAGSAHTLDQGSISVSAPVPYSLSWGRCV